MSSKGVLPLPGRKWLPAFWRCQGNFRSRIEHDVVWIRKLLKPEAGLFAGVAPLVVRDQTHEDFPIESCVSLLCRTDADHAFPKIVPIQHADEGGRRVFQSIHDLLAVMDFPGFEPGGGTPDEDGDDLSVF
jgi:hypothetical protein